MVAKPHLADKLRAEVVSSVRQLQPSGNQSVHRCKDAKHESLAVVDMACFRVRQFARTSRTAAWRMRLVALVAVLSLEWLLRRQVPRISREHIGAAIVDGRQ